MIDLKKIMWLFVAVMIGNIDAMEIVPVPNIAILTNDFVSEFPSDTFAQAFASNKQIAPKQLCFEQNCYKRTLIFDIATQLPADLQRSIALLLFSFKTPESELAGNLADEFLRMPIAQALDCYSYKKEVDEGRAALQLKENINVSTYWNCSYVDKIFTDPITVFVLAKEIEKIDTLLQRDSQFKNGVSREELQALVKIVEKDPFLKNYWSRSIPHCNIKKQLTLSRFGKHLKNVVSETITPYAIALGPLMAATLSRVIELKLCDKVDIESAIQQNCVMERANEWMAQSEDISLMPCRFPMLPTMDYSFKDECKMYIPYIFGLSGWFVLSGGKIEHEARSDDCWQLKLAFCGGFLSLVALAIYVPRECVVEGYLTAVGLYGVACCLMAIIKAQAAKKYKIPFDKISKILGQKDIKIISRM